MAPQTMRLAIGQINPTVGDLAGNAARILACVRRASEAGARLAVFPELAVCGYPPEDLLLRRRFVSDCADTVRRIADASSAMTVVVGFPYAENGALFNGVACLQNGRIAARYAKRELPNYGVFDEKRYFSPGPRPCVLDLQDFRIFVTVCEDVWIEGGAVERDAMAAAPHAVLNLAASPYHMGKSHARHRALCGFARRARSSLVCANQVGGQDELIFDGGSFCANAEGAIVAQAARFEEDLLVTDFPPGSAVSGSVASGTEAEEPGEVLSALALGVRDYARKNGFQKAVLGLSGGIDSALTAAIAVRALGEDRVVAVTMPSRYSSESTRSDALRVAAHLGIPILTIPIEPIFSAYEETLFASWEPPYTGTAMENVQARIRGNLLMALSNRYGWLVLTTGNKSEIATGYCTLYGDTAGGFAVLRDVPKTLVYRLVAHINAEAGREIVPRSIVQRAPTAELRPDQKDEDSLPPYAVLDPILQAYVESDRAPEEMRAGGRDPGVVRRVVELVDGSEYKRKQAPPGPRITPRAFGKDRRMPITNGYRWPETGP